MTPAEERAEDFQALLEHLKSTRGFDFGGYKTGTLERRVDKRMREIPAETYGDYVDYLEVHASSSTRS